MINNSGAEIRMAHSLRALKNAAVRNTRNTIPRQCSNVISAMDHRFMSIFRAHECLALVSKLVSLIQTFTPTLNHQPSKRLFFKRLVNQCHSKQYSPQQCCYHNSLPWTNDTQKRYYISTEGVAEAGIGGFHKKNLA